jgi:hypothetical protein
MSKQTLVLVVAGAAALLLLKSMQSDGGSDGEAEPTAGDDSSNLLEDGVDTVISMFSGWPARSEPYQDLIVSAANDYGIPVSILAWLLWQESRYNPAIIDGTQRSRAGAMGIAQFMPATAAQELGSADAALDPSVAIPGAARYLAKLYGALGAWDAALGAYNWGLGNVQRRGLAAAPAETRDYVTTILAKAGLA